MSDKPLADMTKDMIRIKTGVSMRSFSNSTQESVVEIPRAEWEAKSGAERDRWLEDIAQETLDNEVEAWAYVDGEG